MKVLTIIKKKQFSRTNVFILNRFCLISKFSLISRTNLLFPFANMVNSSKERILKFKRWSQISLSFDNLIFLDVKAEIPVCSPDLTFKCLFVSS